MENNNIGDKPKYEIPTHDPQTGEVNPYYEELTGKSIEQPRLVIIPESDMDKLNRFLITVANTDGVGIRRKVVMIKKFLEVLGDKED